MIDFLRSSLGSIILAVTTLLTALFIARQGGKSAQRAEDAQKTLKSVEAARETDRRVDAADDADRQRLRDKWTRS
jgi:hypothetical protein